MKKKEINATMKLDAIKQHHSISRYIIFSVVLFVLILAIGSTAFLSSMRQIIRTGKGNELSKLLELERTKLEITVDKEIADVLNMATSPLIQRYFENPSDEAHRERAMDVINTYRYATVGSVFWINDIDRMFYFEDREPYLVNPSAPENKWYFKTMRETEIFNFNVNYNPNLNLTKLWINAPVVNRARTAVGMLGSAIDISGLIGNIYSVYEERGVEFGFYFFNNAGGIVGAKDVSKVSGGKNIAYVLGEVADDILDTAKTLAPNEVRTFSTDIGQVAVAKIEMFDWFAVAILPDSIDDFRTPMTIIFVSGILIIAFILVCLNLFAIGLIKPLHKMINIASEASKAKSSFLATMSHEIRTPMNAIIGIAQIELQKDGLSEEFATALGKIYDSGNNLLGIINDVLDMSKIESGKLEVNPVNYDTPSLINDTVQLNMVRIGSKPIEFLLDVDKDLPSRMLGDDLRIKQILNNLLSNAIKYTQAGSVKLAVNHFYNDSGDLMMRFRVSDTGQGLKPEDLKKLFSEYTRFNASANRTTEGTGIGLNITQNLVKMMGGKINVESVYGKGSTFEVVIKQDKVECPPIGAELAEKLRDFKFSGKKHFANLQITRELMPYGKVLVVDDVESNLYVAKGLMTPYKLSVDTAISGFEAIDKVNAGNTYDIIFMDHMMPEMDGIETTKKLREQGYKGVIVALTANAIVGNEEMFLSSGFDGFISKPIDVRRLNSVLNKFVRDKYPEEAAKYKSEQVKEASSQTTSSANDLTPNDLSALDPKLLEIVRKDAEKAAAKLRETKENGDIKLFTTNAHAMKSALANIGEKEMSAAAFALENAGRNGDLNFISANADKFIESLLALVEKLSPAKDESDDENADISEDTAYLKQQLSTVKSACEDYDDAAAYAVLDKLKEKSWKKETTAALEEIRDTLFLHSDFDKAVEQVDKILGGM